MARLEAYDRLGVVGVHLSDDGSGGRVRLRNGRLRLSYRLSAADADTLRFGIAQAARIHFAAGAREVHPQVGGLGVIGPADVEGIERAGGGAAALRLEAFHPMGTARMGSDARTAVVAPTGEAHDLPGLHVADASVFPTSLGVNPMVTIMAAARRVAAGLADRLS
jgi:choline dehydrogenase-like flavoprotein